MENKYKIILVLFLLGIVFSIVGALFKIMHWPAANLLLLLGMLTEAATLITLIIVILKKPK